MTLSELIKRLERAEKVERIFDGEIGALLGWRRQVDYIKNDANGEPTKRVFWIVPSSDDPGTVPFFTSSLDAAVDLMKAIAPADVWGVSMADGTGTAIIGSGPYCHAPTPAMALCIAALKAKLMREGDK
ncbi:hypothetical protein [Sinorhizobium fredii]|uniref:Phage ABA sandwich domain-containing protein n=1 Tax=Rhizobium fredii TaxID=380 RepID=A0A2L0H4N1_RHIFR|nr:hypothetical protein [Sinorhizobium fredii]AUX76423.1 hypothetical protein NXT3_CH01855 [Sinorhizobium fredii]